MSAQTPPVCACGTSATPSHSAACGLCSGNSAQEREGSHSPARSMWHASGTKDWADMQSDDEVDNTCGQPSTDAETVGKADDAFALPPLANALTHSLLIQSFNTASRANSAITSTAHPSPENSESPSTVVWQPHSTTVGFEPLSTVPEAACAASTASSAAVVPPAVSSVKVSVPIAPSSVHRHGYAGLLGAFGSAEPTPERTPCLDAVSDVQDAQVCCLTFHSLYLCTVCITKPIIPGAWLSRCSTGPTLVVTCMRTSPPEAAPRCSHHGSYFPGAGGSRRAHCIVAVQVDSMLAEAQIGIAAGRAPEAALEGMGGTYFLASDGGSRVAIFKPCDEEPLAPNNPKQWQGRAMGMPGMKPSVRVGEAALREVAAYLLDHDAFAGVPAACLAKCYHPALNYKVRLLTGSYALDSICHAEWCYAGHWASECPHCARMLPGACMALRGTGACLWTCSSGATCSIDFMSSSAGASTANRVADKRCSAALHGVKWNVSNSITAS